MACFLETPLPPEVGDVINEAALVFERDLPMPSADGDANGDVAPPPTERPDMAPETPDKERSEDDVK